MCDYSLMNLPNRLANEGEILMTHKFPSGSIGFASLPEICDYRRQAECKPARVWPKLKAWFRGSPPLPVVPAVCIPPGARLKVRSITEKVRKNLNAELDQELTFTQVSAAGNHFRDALRVKNGHEVLLQNVGTGLQVLVVSLALAEELQPHAEFVGSLTPRR